MEFDKSKVYTAVNADEVKIGSKGYFATTIADLRIAVENNFPIEDVKDIREDSYTSRFGDNNGDYLSFFYLVEEPKEKKFRPYKDTDEMIEDFIERFNLLQHNYSLPLMWIKAKDADLQYQIIRFSGPTVSFVNNNSVQTYFFDALLKEYTYLDGSPCGIKEE